MRKSYHLLQHGWTLKALCEVKSVRQSQIRYDLTYMCNQTKQNKTQNL